MAEMERYAGWSVRHLWYVLKMPETLSDLIIEWSFEANFVPLDFFTSKEAAIQKLKSILTEQRDQALRDLDFLSKPYISPNRILHIDRPELLEQWRAECRASLEIANKGLELCEGNSSKNG